MTKSRRFFSLPTDFLSAVDVINSRGKGTDG